MTSTEAPSAPEPNDGVPFPKRLRVLADHPYLVVLVVAVVARLVFAIVSFKVNRYLIPDEQQYVELATTVSKGKPAESWFTNYGQLLYDTTWPYTAVVRFLYEVLWPTRLIAQLWNAVGGVGTAVLTTVLARRVVSPFFAAVAGLIVAILPSQVLWTSVALREGIVWWCLAGIAVLLAFALERRSARSLAAIFVGLAVLLVAVSHLRNQTFVAVVWATMLAAWFGSRNRLVRGGGALLLGLLVPIWLGLGPATLDYVTNNAKTISERRTYLALNADSGITDTTVLTPKPTDEGSTGTGGKGRRTTTTIVGSTGVTGKTPREHVDSPAGKGVVVPGYFGESYLAEETTQATLHHLPRGLLATLIRPFPWDKAPNGAVEVAKVENVLWYALYVLALAGAWIGRRKAALAFPVILGSGIIAIAGVSQGNVGTAFRHRGQVGWILAVLAAVALEPLWARMADRRAGSREDVLVEREALTEQRS